MFVGNPIQIVFVGLSHMTLRLIQKREKNTIFNLHVILWLRWMYKIFADRDRISKSNNVEETEKSFWVKCDIEQVHNVNRRPIHIWYHWRQQVKTKLYRHQNLAYIFFSSAAWQTRRFTWYSDNGSERKWGRERGIEWSAAERWETEKGKKGGWEG